ncbi:hypothetical protein D3C81_1003100 [compost metagenome]
MIKSIKFNSILQLGIQHDRHFSICCKAVPSERINRASKRHFFGLTECLRTDEFNRVRDSDTCQSSQIESFITNIDQRIRQIDRRQCQVLRESASVNGCNRIAEFNIFKELRSGKLIIVNKVPCLRNGNRTFFNAREGAIFSPLDRLRNLQIHTAVIILFQLTGIPQGLIAYFFQVFRIVECFQINFLVKCSFADSFNRIRQHNFR